MVVLVCIGSSCHLKGSYHIVELLNTHISKHHLESEVTLAGSFCVGKCNRDGVTVQVDDEIYIGVTKEGFESFFEEKILKALEKERDS